MVLRGLALKGFMTLRKKITLWTVGLCLVAFVALAANPSFSSFITTQFAVDNNVVKIKDGVTLTNASAVTSLNLAYATASTLLQASAGKNAVSFANAAGVLYDDGAGAFAWADGSTNALTGSAAFPVVLNTKPLVLYYSNLAANITFSSVSGFDSTHLSQGAAVFTCKNGSNQTVTLSSDWVSKDGSRTITVTNGIEIVISLSVYPGVRTNAFVQAMF